MKPTYRLTGSLAIGLAIVGATDDKSYKEELLKFRAAEEASLLRPEGWLAVDGLFWLSEGDNSVGSAPKSKVLLPADSSPASIGTLILSGGLVTFKVASDKPVTINGKPAAEEQPLKTDADGPADKVKVGDATFKIIVRGAKTGVRLYNPNCDNRKNFKGLTWFEVDPAMRIEAKFVPHNPPKQMPITNVLGDTAPVENPGYAEFTIRGKRFRLEAEKAGDGLFFNFWDRTCNKVSYPAGRFLDADGPKDGKVILDFNKATNPPCAHTDYATCPLPPASNRLEIEIRAGEQYVHKE